MIGVNMLFLLITAIIILFWATLNKLDNRYKKIEKDIDEIKNRINDLRPHKVTANAVDETVYTRKTASDAAQKSTVIEEVSTVPVVVAAVVTAAEEEEEKEKEEVPKAFFAEPAENAFQQSTPETPAEDSVVRERKQTNYEAFIGENLFGKIGILIFVIGVGFFVKYAIDNDWINETMRTVLGFLIGSALLAIAERLQKKYRTFSSLLAGGAFAVFYLTVAIAYHYYHLFPQTAAFIILVFVTVFMTILSVLYDRRELAVISLIGGFLAPFIVSSGEGSYLVLFTYLSILNLGMFGLSIYKKWSELPVISFCFTYVVMEAYVFSSGHTWNSTTVSAHLFVFTTLFYFIFLLPVLPILKTDGKAMNRVLLGVVVANNFLYLGFGSLFLDNMLLPFKATGLLSLFIATVNLGFLIGLRKSKSNYKLLIYSLLGLVLTFVSITVPIQLDGNYITLFWSAEMVVLLWLYIKSKLRVYEYASCVLVFLSFISYLLDAYGPIPSYPFANSSFATSLFMGLATGAFALLMERNRSFFATTRLLKYKPWNALMFLASTSILYYSFMREFYIHFEEPTSSGAILLLTTGFIFAVSVAYRNRFPIEKYSIWYHVSMGAGVLIYGIFIWLLTPASADLLRWLAGGFVIANIYYVSRRYIALAGLESHFLVYLSLLSTLLWLTFIRYFLWQTGESGFSAGFSVALSISGLVSMMLGMHFSQKTLRMVSLVTFGIVLSKLVLIDLWTLSALGRIVVFILLGAILLVLSFLYQKLKDILFKDDKNEEM